MTDEDGPDRVIDVEIQRSYMHRMLRDAGAAIVIVITPEGEMASSYMNLNPIERRGLIELLGDTAPNFYSYADDDDEDDDPC